MKKRTWIVPSVILSFIVITMMGCDTPKENLLKNPSFEEVHNGRPAFWETMAFEPDNSQFAVEKGAGRSGQRFAAITSTSGNDARYWQRVPVQEFKCYKITAWAKTENIGKKGLGANISIMENLLISNEIHGTHHKWKRLELYIQAGEGVQSVTVAVGLGGYGSLNTGKVWFDYVQMVEVDVITPVTVVAAPGTIENAIAITNSSSNSVFDYGLMIWIFLILIIIFILVYWDISGKQGLYFSWKIYLVLAGLLLILFMLFVNFPHWFTTETIQSSFMVILVSVIICAVLLWKTKKINSNAMAILLIVLGIALRICYFLYTGPETRQHDVLGEWGHFDYIRYIANHWSLSASGVYQLYHPPIHYFISGAIFFLGKLFGLTEPLLWRLVQLGMVFLSSLALIYFYKTLKQLNCGGTATTIGVAIFAFHPTNIFLAGFLNNDNTMMFFIVLSFYFLIRWVNQHSLKNVLWLAICTSLAILTKKSAFLLLPMILIIVLITWVNDRTNLRTYLKQAGYFSLIAIPAAIIYPLRNYYLFQQSISYAPEVPFEPLSNSFATLFGISLQRLFQYPFTIFSYYNINLEKNPDSFLEYLFKSSLFGEWRFENLETIAIILIALALVNLINLILTIGFYFMAKDKNTRSYDLLFWLNIFFFSILVFKARWDSPFFCTQNFRYLAPILISIAYLLGQTVQRLADRKKLGLKYISISLAVAFCTASTIFILKIGV